MPDRLIHGDDGVVEAEGQRLQDMLQEGARDGHLGVCEHRLPARLVVLEPAPDALPIGQPGCLRYMVRNVTEALRQRKPPQALPLPRPV